MCGPPQSPIQETAFAVQLYEACGFLYLSLQCTERAYGGRVDELRATKREIEKALEQVGREGARKRGSALVRAEAARTQPPPPLSKPAGLFSSNFAGAKFRAEEQKFRAPRSYGADSMAGGFQPRPPLPRDALVTLPAHKPDFVSSVFPKARTLKVEGM